MASAPEAKRATARDWPEGIVPRGPNESCAGDGCCGLGRTKAASACMTDDLFFSVDCETSGPFPGRHALLSIGAVVIRREQGGWVLGDSHYSEWAPREDAEEDPNATRVHGLDLAALRKLGVNAVNGARDFTAWVSGQGGERRVFVGYNVAFDWAFVLHAIGVADAGNPFHHAPLDLKSAIWGAVGGTWRDNADITALERLLGQSIARESDEQAHNALDDARLQGRVLVHLLNHLAH